MSGVGSTNAMKKGSANNPFLAYSKEDMQGYLKSAYTGCIVKYAGSSTMTGVPRGKGLNLGDAQNLVVDLTKSFTDNQGLSKSRKWYITIESETGNKCIMDITINKQTGVIGTPELISDTIKALIYSIYTPYSSLIGSNINDLDVKFLSVTGTDVDRNVVTNWPTTSGWQKDCFNDSGKITLWGYGERVTAIQNQNDSDYWSAYPILYTEPYVANVLYKVVYSNGQYYFEEFYHISDNVTTATVEDVALGKTFYDFTGTKQTGTGTKINPYLATDLDTFKSFPIGSFIKWLGPNRTVLDETTGQMLIQNEIYRAVEEGDILQYVILPTLSNPGTAADLAQGKQLIDGEGDIVVGTRSGDVDYTQDYMFWDYDGTLVASYSYDELQSLESLPEGPNHTAQGLRFISWGVDLSTLKSSISKSADICAKYEIIDGKTHIFIDSSYLLNGVMYLYLYKQANSSKYNIDVTVDWGDGTVEDLYYDTNHAIQHTYLDTTKKYEITIKNKNSQYGYNMFYYKNYNCCNVYVSYSEVNNANKMYNSDIKISSSLAIIGMYVSNINSWDTYSIYSNFAFCKNLKFVVFEYLNFANLPAYGLFNTGLKFYSCKSVESPDALYKSNVQILAINKPDSSSIRSSLDMSIAPSSRLPLKRLCISHTLSTPSSTQGIDGNSYDICKVALPSNQLSMFKSYTNVSLESAMYGYQSQPESIATYSCIKKFYFLDKSSKYTTLPAASFQGSHINELHMQWSTPPTLTEWFTNFVVDKIFVPTASLDAYKAATGWSDVADKIFAEEVTQ